MATQHEESAYASKTLNVLMLPYIISRFAAWNMAKLGFAAFSFSLPLVAISLFRTSGDSITLFSPPLFVSVVFLVTNFGKVITLRARGSGISLSLIALFVLFALISLLVNSMRGSSIMVQTAGLLFQNADVNTETFARFARIVYSLIIVGLMTILFLDQRDRSFEEFGRYYLRGYYVGAFFGVWQFFSPLFGVPFWSPFGNEEWMISNQNAGFGMTRINGSASEPSNWVPYCVIALSILFINRRQYGRKAWLFFVTLVVFNLIGSLSGTAAVAFLFWLIGWTVVVMVKTTLKRMKLKELLLFVLLIGIVGILTIYVVANTDVLAKQFGEGLVQKSAGEDPSGFMRLYVFNITWDAFLKSPIFGVGVGSLVAYNTFATILASGGVMLGLVYFMLVGAGLISTTRLVIEQMNIERTGWFLLSWGMLGVTSITYGEIFSFISWLWLFACLNARSINDLLSPRSAEGV